MTREQIRRVVGYIRVSTLEQAESGLGLDAQREAIRKHCEYRGWELVAVLEDHTSGKSTNGRHQLAAALAKLKAREADALIVAKLDRLGRSSWDIASINETSRKQGWAIVALDLDIDTSTPMGEAMMSMAAVFAQLEGRMIGVRTKEALAQLKAQGVKLGGPRSISDEVAANAKSLKAAGVSYERIGAELGLGWTTVRRLVNRA